MSTTTFSWDKDDWATLTEMADGFDEYRPAPSAALAGQRHVLHCNDSRGTFTLVHEFSPTTLTWTLSRDGEDERQGEETYQLFEVQPGLFFLHHRRGAEDHPVVVTGALDTTSGLFTAAVGELGLHPEPHRARQAWFQGVLEGSAAAPGEAHGRTAELVGRRVRYAYSRDDVYDHVYLNEDLFTWLCLGGAERGVADTDTTTCWKLRPRTYLFSWLEKNVGVEGMVLIDLERLRTVGIQFGLDQRTGELVDLTMGAHALDLGAVPGLDAATPGPRGLA